MSSQKVRVTQDLLRRVRCIHISWSGFSTGGPGLNYADQAKEWIEHELFVRDSIEVDQEAIRALILSCEMTIARATLQAVVDRLTEEFDKAQGWVPETVAFTPVVG